MSLATSKTTTYLVKIGKGRKRVGEVNIGSKRYVFRLIFKNFKHLYYASSLFRLDVKIVLVKSLIIKRRMRHAMTVIV